MTGNGDKKRKKRENCENWMGPSKPSPRLAVKCSLRIWNTPESTINGTVPQPLQQKRWAKESECF